MIQIQLGSTGIIVLEPKNIEMLKAGKLVRLPMSYFRQPVDAVVLDFTPDVDWVADQIALLFHGKSPSEVDPKAIQEIINKSKSRPEVAERPDHPMLNVLEKLPRQ